MAYPLFFVMVPCLSALAASAYTRHTAIMQSLHMPHTYWALLYAFLNACAPCGLRLYLVIHFLVFNWQTIFITVMIDQIWYSTTGGVGMAMVVDAMWRWRDDRTKSGSRTPLIISTAAAPRKRRRSQAMLAVSNERLKHLSKLPPPQSHTAIPHLLHTAVIVVVSDRLRIG